MYSLEDELRRLRSAGGIDEQTAAQELAIDSRAIFSLHQELRVAFYAAVALVVTGVGILVKAHLDRIGPLTLTVALALAGGACYLPAIRARSRQTARSAPAEYLLLLGALLVSADLGYAESQFHWLGPNWSRYLLILAVFHALTAYIRLDAGLARRQPAGRGICLVGVPQQPGARHRLSPRTTVGLDRAGLPHAFRRSCAGGWISAAHTRANCRRHVVRGLRCVRTAQTDRPVAGGASDHLGVRAAVHVDGSGAVPAPAARGNHRAPSAPGQRFGGSGEHGRQRRTHLPHTIGKGCTVLRGRRGSLWWRGSNGPVLMRRVVHSAKARSRSHADGELRGCVSHPAGPRSDRAPGNRFGRMR
ncbi:MAG: DUF2157 domain-containing protein [Proteobacteria bacterium]|nr:DUF2157 domain-containing protein [Pseudomonadota bacterium]